MSFNQF